MGRLSEGDGGIEHFVEAMAEVVFELVAEEGEVGNLLFLFASVDGRVEVVGKEMSHVVDRGLYGHAVASVAVHPRVGKDLHDGGLTLLVGAVEETCYGFEVHVFLRTGLIVHNADRVAHFVQTVDEAFEVYGSSVEEGRFEASKHPRFSMRGCDP